MSKRITEFTLAGSEWTIEYVDDMEENIGGCCDVINKRIEIATRFGGKPVPKKFQEEALQHELVHAILDSIGSELAGDEVFVQSFSAMLNQFNKTKK